MPELTTQVGVSWICTRCWRPVYVAAGESRAESWHGCAQCVGVGDDDLQHELAEVRGGRS